MLLASASNAIIIGFNVRPDRNAADIADRESVDIRLHSVIYNVVDEMKKAMAGLLEPTFKEVRIGTAVVRDTFKVPKFGTIAGCMVTDGRITRSGDTQARLLRDNVVVFEGKIGSLRRFKDDVSEVKSGFECGIGFERFNDIKVGDVIEAFVVERVATPVWNFGVKGKGKGQGRRSLVALAFCLLPLPFGEVCYMPSTRPSRVGDQLRAEISDLLAREVHDPGIGFLTITQVTVSPDLQIARVYYTTLGDERARRDTARALGRATPFLRRQLGSRLRLKRVPLLEFFFDESVERGDRIERILNELSAERGESPRRRPPVRFDGA